MSTSHFFFAGTEQEMRVYVADDVDHTFTSLKGVK